MAETATDRGRDGQRNFPYLLTPGPLTTSLQTKQVMLDDWGSRDVEFRALIKSIRARLVDLAGGGDGHECVLLQGSGTFAIEAALSSFVPRDGKALVAINGAYGTRAAKILDYLGRAHVDLDVGDSTMITASDIAESLEADRDITDVFVVHCETTSGIVNPVHEICAAIKARGVRVIVDAMSSFGALPLDMTASAIDVMVSSANKCIEGVPGFGYVVCRRDLLEASKGRSHSLSLDLFDQWHNMERTEQFRFTPPTHGLVAFAQALDQHAAEGGVAARGKRYARNRDVLVSAMRKLGFETLLDDGDAGPIIQTFLTPQHPNFDFDRFYNALRDRGYAIYPGKLTRAPSFRIGTIGHLDEDVMRGAVSAIEQVLSEMNIADLKPAAA
jgi:2-aminoethylphosphonate-pyruvate transaminase